MKKVLEDITGIVGVGCLVSLGLLFLIDSYFHLWGTLNNVMGVNSWGVLIPVPILIVNYIFGLVSIELADLLVVSLINKKEQEEFKLNFIRVAKLNNVLITSRYTDVYQNKRIINGSTLGLIIISIGVFLEGIQYTGDWRWIGIIGMVGSILTLSICQYVGLKIQVEFNQQLADFTKLAL